MARTVVVTGSASGIGQATADRLRAAGQTVIGVDLRDAEVVADLGTRQGRASMADAVARLAPDGVDAVLAGAGIAKSDKPRETVAINYFGAVGTLEALRPLLARSPRPRAVAICSTAALLPTNENVVAACLEHDEEKALAAVSAAPETSYQDSKRALSLWLRRTAVRPEWAGSGILLNGVAPGTISTPISADFQGPEYAEILKRTNPTALAEQFGRPEDVAELLDFLLAFEGAYLLGQIIFIDGGTDAILRPDAY